jgi:tetratricopeptide (TPR) repeat protein
LVVDPISWAINFSLTTLAKGAFQAFRSLSAKLEKAVREWSLELPADVQFNTEALFGGLGPNYNKSEFPAHEALGNEVKACRIPTADMWFRALLERWQFVQRGGDVQAFFQQPKEVAEAQLWSLAKRLETVCVRDKELFRVTSYELLSDLTAKFDHLDILSHANFPLELVDQKIEDEVARCRKTRFFDEFARVDSSLTLARSVTEGELSGGTNTVRSRALSWCVRILAYTEEAGKAEEYLRLAKTLGLGPEIEVANAFMLSHRGNKSAALSALAAIDLPISRSAAFMIVAHHDGPGAAIEWLNTVGIEATDLDSDGRFFLSTLYLQLSRWEAALKCLDAITEDDLRETPVLHHVMAITHLLQAVPAELRAVVVRHPPLEVADFPLASDSAAIETRRVAHRHFVEAAKVARQLNCSAAAILEDEYGLWLKLRDPEKSEEAKRCLEDKLRDSKTALRLVHFGLQFGIKLDLEAVDRDIERQVALNGGITRDAATARFALAFAQKTPEDIANYIARHFDELAKHFDKKGLQFLQIEMLSRAGLPERAMECLDRLLQEGLSAAEESSLRRIIAEAEGTDPIEVRKKQFISSNSLGDLMSLVNELESKREWDGLCEYGEMLFERTRSLNDAERLATAFANSQKNDKLVVFLRKNKDLLVQSMKLQMIYCWSLYYEGAFLEARSELAKLGVDRDDNNYRALQVNLGIALGDWNSLLAVIANECREKDKRSADELLRAAHLAFHLGSANAKELVFAATSKSDSNAGILASAYFLASNAGWENEPEVSQWLLRAAELSGTEGPLQKMSLKDIIDRKPEWERRESEVWRQLSRGDMPMFMAARALNRSLIDFMLFPGLANLSEKDPRRRGTIGAYSGRRDKRPFNIGGRLGIDATALLTLSFLDLLDDALDAFEKVHVPHSTLTWLLEEKQKAAFHQPSRIKDAHLLRNLLATGALEKLVPSAVPDSDLCAQIGEELALLIAEAEKTRSEANPQCVVVRSSPVHRIGSLMEEEADLTPHTTVLVSCQAIADKLREKGQLTAEEEKKARAYLQLYEKPWPHKPEITDGAILYMDDLSATYFLHLGILQKIQAAGYRPVVSPRKVAEVNELISYEGISSKVNDAIESIRNAVNSRIESGKIIVGKRSNTDEPRELSITEGSVSFLV